MAGERGRATRALGAAALALALLGGCEIERAQIPRTEPQLSVHGLLSASAETQVVLLERTRNGSVSILAPPLDLPDATVRDNGVGELAATVTMTTPTGDVLLGIEDSRVRDDHRGGGIYRFYVPGSFLVRGAPYRLAIRTTRGEELFAETTVPGGEPAMTAEARTFDRSRDTLALEWAATPGARAYYVRVETPYGPRAFLTDSTRVRLTGELRNVERDELPHVFIPGFPQAVTVSAVDSNYYDWYRSHNNEITGRGLVSRVRGGLGLFGSLVRLRFLDLRVTTPQTEPVAGRFDIAGTAAERSSTPQLWLDLYVESRASRGDQADAISGQYMIRPTFSNSSFDPVRGLLGTARNGKVVLHFFEAWSAQDTVETFTGELHGDTLVGGYRFAGGPYRFVRQR